MLNTYVGKVQSQDTTGDDRGSGGSILTPDIISLFSYDETTDLTGSLSQLLTNTPPTAIGASTSDQAEAALRCKAFFAADLSTSSTSTSDEESSKTQSLQGTGIEFGYDFEKYSLSFNQLQWSGGDDKLQAQMLLFHYFLPYALSMGGGFASANLDTEFGSDSGTAPPFFILATNTNVSCLLDRRSRSSRSSRSRLGILHRKVDSQPSITQADLVVFGDGVIGAKMKNGGAVPESEPNSVSSLALAKPPPTERA